MPFQVTRHPLLVVLSGPSGVGKTTITNALVEQGWDGHIVVTVTTRRPRPGEQDGVHYHFRTQEEFQRMVEQGELLEHAEVHGNWYGVPATTVRQKLSEQVDTLLTIDPQGAEHIRERTQDAVFIFLAPESLDALVERVEARASETPEQKTLRLLNAEREVAALPSYDYLIVNRQGQLEDAVAHLRAILLAEHCRVHPRLPRV